MKRITNVQSNGNYRRQPKFFLCIHSKETDFWDRNTQMTMNLWLWFWQHWSVANLIVVFLIAQKGFGTKKKVLQPWHAQCPIMTCVCCLLNCTIHDINYMQLWSNCYISCVQVMRRPLMPTQSDVICTCRVKIGRRMEARCPGCLARCDLRREVWRDVR